MRVILNQVMGKNEKAKELTTSGTLCAIGITPDPADSFSIRVGLFTVLPNSEGLPRSLDQAILDSFRALQGMSLLHSSVVAPTPPPAGILTVEYPTEAPGKGPVLLRFTSFDLLESVAFNTDPDSYDNAGFDATVQDPDGRPSRSSTILRSPGVRAAKARWSSTPPSTPHAHSSLRFSRLLLDMTSRHLLCG